jgi:4'-phosphopantetheinyl transferase
MTSGNRFPPPRFVREGESALLPSGEVQVWVINVAEAGAGLESPLSPAELERAGRMPIAAQRNRYLASRTSLREVLGLYLGQAPREVALQTLAHGKPMMGRPEEAWLRFNLSHSLDLAVLACCRDVDVGVDAEAARPRIEAGAIVQRFFSPAERLEWAALAEARRPAAFLRGWTSKEAYVKGLGEGLRHPSDAYTVRLDPEFSPALLGDQLRPGAERSWTLHSVPVPHGYTATVAVGAPEIRLKLRGGPVPQE